MTYQFVPIRREHYLPLGIRRRLECFRGIVQTADHPPQLFQLIHEWCKLIGQHARDVLKHLHQLAVGLVKGPVGRDGVTPLLGGVGRILTGGVVVVRCLGAHAD
jgi:hypothetical protein